jgi:microcystin-dependent protein
MSNVNLSVKQNLDIDNNSNVLLPSGAIILKAANQYTTSENDLSEGLCPCDGRALSRTTYENLFNIIGTQYGTGNGSTTFNVPTLAYFLSMPTSSASLGTQVGAANHTHTANANATGSTTNVGFDHAHYLGFTTGGGASHGDYFGGFYANVSGPNGGAQNKRDGNNALAAINHSHAMSFAAIGLGGGGDHAHYLTATHGTANGTGHAHNYTSTVSSVSAATSDPPYTTCLALIKL